MTIYLLDESVSVTIYFEPTDCEFNDNICVSFDEECPVDEKIFRAGQSNIYITAHQARALAEALIAAASASDQACPE